MITPVGLLCFFGVFAAGLAIGFLFGEVVGESNCYCDDDDGEGDDAEPEPEAPAAYKRESTEARFRN
jgi:hypothetical protein